MKTPRPKITAQAHLNTTKYVARIHNIMKKAQGQKNTNKKILLISKQPINLYSH